MQVAVWRRGGWDVEEGYVSHPTGEGYDGMTCVPSQKLFVCLKMAWFCRSGHLSWVRHRSVRCVFTHAVYCSLLVRGSTPRTNFNLRLDARTPIYSHQSQRTHLDARSLASHPLHLSSPELVVLAHFNMQFQQSPTPSCCNAKGHRPRGLVPPTLCIVNFFSPHNWKCNRNVEICARIAERGNVKPLKNNYQLVKKNKKVISSLLVRQHFKFVRDFKCLY